VSRYSETIEQLRKYYDRDADRRESQEKADWKIRERAHFLKKLQDRNCHRLLELGAGTGQDSLFFEQNGLDVVATDLSPVMVEHCRLKGLNAHVMDFLSLDFPAESFDALYAVNCLLHVPKVDLQRVLHALRPLLKPDGLFYMGLYGGEDSEITTDEDIGKRLFVSHSDSAMTHAVEEAFTIEYYRRIDFPKDAPACFYSMVLMKTKS
jgi:SAM-dependent methyltransferase|tara:strand:- start:890 stop:1513 length:624 start_codon:yes stop_codon:yes gene_type:complete